MGSEEQTGPADGLAPLSLLQAKASAASPVLDPFSAEVSQHGKEMFDYCINKSMTSKLLRQFKHCCF